MGSLKELDITARNTPPSSPCAPIVSNILPDSPHAPKDDLVHFGAPPIPRAAAALSTYERWRAVLDAPRELFIVLLLKMLSSYAYFSTLLVLSLWLTDEIGLSDIAAGWVYGVYGMATTVWGIVGGVAIDWMGVKVSIALGSALATVSRVILMSSVSKTTTIVVLWTALPLAESMGIPVMSVAIKRYTNQSNKQLGFSLFYSFMNVAALLAGLGTDFIRYRLVQPGTYVTIVNIHMTYFRVVFFTGAVATWLCFVIVLCGVRELEVDERGRARIFRPNRENPCSQIRRVLHEPTFWRLGVLTILLIGVRLIFRHLDATLPKYMVRVFGEKAPFGSFYALEPLIVIFAVPVAGSVLYMGGAFPLIIVGSFIAGMLYWLRTNQPEPAPVGQWRTRFANSTCVFYAKLLCLNSCTGASPFWLCLGNKVRNISFRCILFVIVFFLFGPVPTCQHNLYSFRFFVSSCAREQYLYVLLFIVTLSLGESIYSPRVYEYTMVCVCPHNRRCSLLSIL